MTSKKMLIAFGGLLAFFAGAVWIDYVPVVAPLVAFLEVCAGFACGYFFMKEAAKTNYEVYEDKIELLQEEVKKYQEASLKSAVKETKAAPKKKAKTETV